jgi:hypothetical protein
MWAAIKKKIISFKGTKMKSQKILRKIMEEPNKKWVLDKS